MALLNRFRDAFMPYQHWCPFPPEAIVLVKNINGDRRVDLVRNLWWGWERDNPEGVIIETKRLDKIK